MGESKRRRAKEKMMVLHKVKEMSPETVDKVFKRVPLQRP